MTYRTLMTALCLVASSSAVKVQVKSEGVFHDIGDWFEGAGSDIGDWLEGAWYDSGDWASGAWRDMGDWIV